MVTYSYYTSDPILCVSRYDRSVITGEMEEICLTYPFTESSLQTTKYFPLHYKWMHWIFLLLTLIYKLPDFLKSNLLQQPDLEDLLTHLSRLPIDFDLHSTQLKRSLWYWLQNYGKHSNLLGNIVNKGKIYLPSDLGLHGLVFEAPNRHDKEEEEEDFFRMSYGQYVSSVGLYSSEYGLGSSAPQLYCATNLVGKPSCYPCAGDDPRVYSLCEFGKWWMTCPSALPNVPFRRPPRIPAQAFIDLKFYEGVIPERLDVLETCESGTIVRIWAWESLSHTNENKMSSVSSSKWCLLYEGEPMPAFESAKKVSLKLRPTTSLVNTLRLEINYSFCQHYPCIDAVLLVGSQGPVRNMRNFPLQIFAERQASKSSGSATSSSGHSSCPSSDSCSVDTRSSKATTLTPRLRNADIDGPDADLDRYDQVREGGPVALNLGSFESERQQVLEDSVVPPQDFLVSHSVMEGLSSLNICNKVIIHGLQNHVRTKEDVLMDGPRHIGSESIENLLTSFGSGAESTALHPLRPAVGSHCSSSTSSCSYLPPLQATEEKVSEKLTKSLDGSSQATTAPERDVFQMLPPEVMLRVLCLLDLRSLCRVAQCCSSLRLLAYHPQLYAHLSLKDWWSVVNDRALASLLKRLNGCNNTTNNNNHHHVEEQKSGSAMDSFPSSYSDLSHPSERDDADNNFSSPTQKNSSIYSSDDESSSSTLEGYSHRPPGTLLSLDLSWCGLYGAITCPMFLDFIHKCGPKLRLLRLSCCDFVDSYCLYMIANVCQKLTELDVSRCYQLDFLGLGELKKLSLLTRLDVSYTCLSTDTAHVLLQHLPLLRHLSVRGCQDLRMDEVCVSLSGFCPELISLVAWKTRGLTHRGVRALASLSNLQDLDLGWAFSNVNSLAGSVSELVQRCQQLVRLRLTACRYLSDADISAIALHCPLLEQLDITGNANVSSDALESVLQNCSQLQLLEVSYCVMLTTAVTDSLKLRYPSVLIVSVADSSADPRWRSLHH
ncbi:F-box domain [Trinorchestia longiramus]|nr:F-box domain [Trinorchestia longiramus]